MKKNTYEVLVGNIGMVYNGGNGKLAKKTFAEYVTQSANNYGRASGEEVAILKNNDILKTYLPPKMYTVFTYDLWGNDKDGWEVNEKYKGESYLIDILWSDKQLIKKFKEYGLIKKNIRYSSITIDDGDEDVIYVEYKGKPAFELINNKLL